MKRLCCLMLALALSLALFAGCGGKDSSSVGSSSKAEVAPTPEPVVEIQPLTGEEQDESYIASRPVAIMINNRADSRPARGLSEADVLYEIMVEGGITRFLALFPDTSFGEVGSVRSARDQFFQVIFPFQPLYLFVGRSEITQQFIDVNGYSDLAVNGMYSTFTHRDQNRIAQGYTYDATAFTSGAEIQSYIDSHGIDMSRELTEPIFDFVDCRESPRVLSGQSALDVKVVHSASYRTGFTYDAASGRYLTSLYTNSEGYTPMIDEANGQQMAFDNVFVLFAEITTYPYPGGNIDPNTGLDKGDPDYKKVNYDAGGTGYYINGGKAEPIHWQKSGIEGSLTFTDESGASVKVNTGRSYVGIVSQNERSNFEITGAEPAVSSASAAE